ncbi:MAG: hypothetical protein M4579_004320 [Chaenotheca gracillima]|nr:MAG: hypothetical protein M4579_004320 [Chaenotheca gracillima]
MLVSFLAFSVTAAASLLSPQHIFSNPDPALGELRIPTVHESAVQARRILHLETLGTLSTIFPTTHSSDGDVSSRENRPDNLGGMPIGLMDYFADCEPSSGNPTILAISIATSFKNVAAGSNITLSLRWRPEAHNSKYKSYSAASLPRFSLIGSLEKIPASEVMKQAIPTCFARYHPDSVAWMPGNPIHSSEWVRLVVKEVYWIGGFGDRAYIGWIPTEQWANVTMEEVQSIRLPGEEKSKGWLGYVPGYGRE